MIDGWGTSCEIDLIWILLDFTDDQSTLVQVMAWCRQATSHYLSQCWPSWPNVDPDLCHHMASLGHDELNNIIVMKRRRMYLLFLSFHHFLSSQHWDGTVNRIPSSWKIRYLFSCIVNTRAVCRFVLSQWETMLLCNDISHWLGASLEWAINTTAGDLVMQGARTNVTMLLSWCSWKISMQHQKG